MHQRTCRKMVQMVVVLGLMIGLSCSVSADIAIQGASAVRHEASRRPDALLLSVAQVQPRIVAEYASQVRHTAIGNPSELMTDTLGVAPHLIVEYASGITTYELDGSGLASSHSARNCLEYAVAYCEW